jgi:hypothetical protein
MTLGSDISGVDDIDFALTLVDGRLALAQAILRRLTTPRGGLIGSPSYGYDLLRTIGAPVPASIVLQRVTEQVLAEEEVLDASVAVALSNGVLQVNIDVEDDEGPFSLTVTGDGLTAAAMIDNNPPFWQQGS